MKSLILVVLTLPFLAVAETPAVFLSNETITTNSLVAIRELDSTILVHLVYATTDNFTGKNLYGDFNRCYLRNEAAEKLMEAQQLLKKKHPGYRLLVYDGLRPRSVQQRMWDMVKGTPHQRYVANPKSGSIHNYGAAVDLTIADATGTPLDMGTPFDGFLCKSQPRYELYFIDSSKITDADLTTKEKNTIRSEIAKQGFLSPAAHRNRLLLREVMESAGFKGIPIEWWHFNAFSKEECRKRFVIVE